MRRTIKFADGREFYLEEQSVQTGWAPSEDDPSLWAAVCTFDETDVLGTAVENGTLHAVFDREKIERLREEFTTGSLSFQANPEWQCLKWERECPMFRLAPNQDLTRLWHKWETFRVRTYGTDPGLFLQWCHDERQADVLISGASHDDKAQRPKLGQKLKPENVSFIKGAGLSRSNAEIRDGFLTQFGFGVSERTVRKYRGGGKVAAS